MKHRLFVLGVVGSVIGCTPEETSMDSAVDPDPENCGESARAEMRMSFLDHYTGQAIEGMAVTVCGVTEVTDASGFVVLALPVDSVTAVDLSEPAEYPDTRFLLRSPDRSGWDWVEEQVGGTLWLPRKVMSLVTLRQLELDLGLESDASTARVSFQISPYGLGFDLTGTALGAQPLLEEVDYDMVVGQTGVSEFEERATLATQEGTVYFHGVSPGTARFGLRNASGENCAFMPAMESSSAWMAEIESGIHTILPFQCRNPE